MKKSIIVNETTLTRLQKVKALMILNELHPQIEHRITNENAINYLIEVFETLHLGKN
jgi:hypothetical protein